jgi:hypothetical protein
MEINTADYVSEFDNKCKLKLHLSLKLVNEVFEELNKNVEYSGEIFCDNNNKHVDTCLNKGDAESVMTPNNIINFHTHPITCYNAGGTCWGWPSGEDIRETIKFALNGNKAHLVFTAEGLYTIQVSPCKLKLMKKLKPDELGILIFIIEEYFKTTHEFRCFKELNALKNINITPYSFVDFTNNFKLSNVLQKCNNKNFVDKRVIDTGHTGIYGNEENKLNYLNGLDQNETFTPIPCLGFPELSDKTMITTPVEKYFIDFSELFQINSCGKEQGKIKFKKQKILEIFKEVVNKIDNTDCGIIWNNSKNSWFQMNLFPSTYYVNKGYLNGNKFITPDKKTLIELLGDPFVKIYSKKEDGCSMNDLAEIAGFKMGGTKFNFGKCTRKSTFGELDEIGYLNSL